MMARGLKFQIKEVEGLCYLCRENKITDQLCGYHVADLHLCRRICINQVFILCDSLKLCDTVSLNHPCVKYVPY